MYLYLLADSRQKIDKCHREGMLILSTSNYIDFEKLIHNFVVFLNRHHWKPKLLPLWNWNFTLDTSTFLSVCIFLYHFPKKVRIQVNGGHICTGFICSQFDHPLTQVGVVCSSVKWIPPPMRPFFFPSGQLLQITAAPLSLGHAVILDRKASIKLRCEMPWLSLLPSPGCGLSIWLTLRK